MSTSITELQDDYNIGESVNMNIIIIQILSQTLGNMLFIFYDINLQQHVCKIGHTKSVTTILFHLKT